MLNIPAFEWRIALHSPAPEAFLRHMDRPGLAVTAVTSMTYQLTQAMETLLPHAIVIDMSGRDGAEALSALQRATLRCPPRIVVVGGAADNWPADAHVDSADDSAGLLNALTQALSAPMGRLSLHKADKLRIGAAELLYSLGMPESLLGFQCAVLAAQWLGAMPPPYPPLRYWLYPLMATRLGVSAGAVERRLRVAIEGAWLRGDMAGQGELFGMTISAERGKPTNLEFLCMMAEHVRARAG